MQDVQDAVDRGASVRLDDRRRLVSSPPRADAEDPAVAELGAAVTAQIPDVELADLLIEVDQWTAFSDELRHAAAATPRGERLAERLYAAVLAAGTLLGPAAMARICDLSERQIAWAEEWYLDPENVASASQRITSYHHQLELTQHLGSGHFSSSDGHRVGQRGRPPTAAMLAREFGHQHGGLTVMSWTLDQYTTYGAKVVSVAEREATHTLDAIVHAHAPDIREHTTDTHGYTVMWTVGCVKGRRRHLSAGSIGSPSSSRRCARRAAVQRWRSTSRGQPRCSASSARRSSVSRRVRSLGA